jgi:hypothetical protein
MFSQACVHGFRVRGLRLRPGMTRFLNFLTRSFPGMTNNPMILLDPFLGSL